MLPRVAELRLAGQPEAAVTTQVKWTESIHRVVRYTALKIEIYRGKVHSWW